ncbi:glycerol-3-phosphate dehydrogenase/oxidase [Microbacterium lushaniae]|uniref:Glycerol-3-phosphate dehydrogenase/oxidase n=1 Tax=Microbacterium lushaniae TaxID=2614639 RepID=A0A5J6L691_9MICO|nr:glycerol-3-phosphate dehydrogenase/oxidase [Microbacterium lushaniae]QEW04003.1 glycerol-3-phosphate dehydrogenase/oxidase [Microbacterium lushaniae]
MPTLRTHSAPQSADVVVIGAGINGLAITREAAARGLHVVMIDRDDIAARTSAISTRLIHGGLKYLPRFEIPLVFESIRERNILLKTAPHLVLPYPMLIPFAKWNKTPGWLMSCGLIVHDVLAIGKRLPLNRIVFGGRLRREWPSVAKAGVKWGGLFQDAHVPVTERFATELAIDASRNGATVLTHTPVTALLRDGGRIAGVVYQDRESGQERELRAPVVVNSAGPWVDEVLALAGTHPRRIGPTKGSHLVVDAFPGAPATCVFFDSPQDGRPMFVLPWWDGRFMLGTTDLPYDGSIEDIAIDQDEVAYLLASVNTIIPDAGLTPDHVLWSYSGVRPLPYVADLTDPSSVSRDSEIVVHDGDSTGLLTIIGGKYTTHRALGEQTLRKIEKQLGLPREASPTREARFPGAPAEDVAQFRASFVARSSLPERTAARLADVYGTLARDIEMLAATDPALSEIVDEETGAIAAEILHAVREEGAVTLEDVLLRRTVIALNSDVGLSCAPRAAAVLVAYAGWSEEHADAEVARYRESVRRFVPRALQGASDADRTL